MRAEHYKYSDDIKILAGRIILIIMALSMSFPAALKEVKLFLVSIAVVLIFLCKNIRVNRITLTMAGFYSMMGIAWSLYGVTKGNIGAINMLTVTAVYPILFFILGLIYVSGDEEKLDKFFIYISWFIVTIDLLYILNAVLFKTELFYFIEMLYSSEVATVDNGSNYFKFTLPNVSSIIFLIPYIMLSLIYNKFSLNKSLLLLLLFTTALLSGRRALLVTAIIAPVIVYCIFLFLVKGNSKPGKLVAIVILIFLSSFVFYLAWPDYFDERIDGIFDFSNNNSNLERQLQFHSLWHDIEISPFFGSGAGAISGYLRSDSQPWAYELSYIANIFHYGFVGFSFYLLGVLFIIVSLISAISIKRKPCFELYYFGGFIGFMIANATNPYLMKFDYMWVIFIPVAMMSKWLHND